MAKLHGEPSNYFSLCNQAPPKSNSVELNLCSMRFHVIKPVKSKFVDLSSNSRSV